MFLYKIASVGYEDYAPVELLHDKKFSRKQLVDMYISCLEEATRQYYAYLKKIERWEDPSEEHETISLLHYKIMLVFIEKYGFKKLQYEVELGVWEYIGTDPEDNYDEIKRNAEWTTIRKALVETLKKCKPSIVAEIKEDRIKNGKSVK